MKTKTNKAKTVRKARSKEQSYPAYYLAALLAGVLLLEGFLLGAATPTAWQEGLQVLDVSAGFNMVLSDAFTVVEPMLVQIHNVETFYQMAATEVIVLFDSSYTDPLALPKVVLEFYDNAAVEMAALLDFSEQFSYFPQVAGAAITR